MNAAERRLKNALDRLMEAARVAVRAEDELARHRRDTRDGTSLRKRLKVVGLAPGDSATTREAG